MGVIRDRFLGAVTGEEDGVARLVGLVDFGKELNGGVCGLRLKVVGGIWEEEMRSWIVEDTICW